MRKLKVLFIILGVIVFLFGLSRYCDIKKDEKRVRERDSAVAAVAAHGQSIQIDLSGYTAISAPVGIDTVAFSAEYSTYKGCIVPTLAFQVYKNSTWPAHGACQAVFQFLDENGQEIGALRSELSDDLTYGKSCTTRIGYGQLVANQDNRITYNNAVIAGIKLLELTESDNSINLLKSEFSTKKNYLQDYLDKGDYAGFFSFFDQVIALYPYDTFPDENADLTNFKASVTAALEGNVQEHTEAAAQSTAEAPAQPEVAPSPASAAAPATPPAKTPKPTNTPKATPSANPSPAETREAYIASCVRIGSAEHEMFLRAPGEYQGVRVMLVGKIVQFIPVEESTLGKLARKLGVSGRIPCSMSVTSGNGDELYIVSYDGSTLGSGLVTGDTVTVYGEFAGTELMEKMFGSDYYPFINAKYMQ